MASAVDGDTPGVDADGQARVRPSAGAEPLLEVRDLEIAFETSRGLARAVNGISYSLEQDQTLAIVGESGSGKTVSAQAVMGIIDMPPGRILGGEILFEGTDLLTISDAELRAIRGRRIGMVFQDALAALNPGFTVGFQVAEMYRVHEGLSRKQARARSIELLDRVRIPSAKDRLDDYPHQFSGGMRQRVMIAIALALEPDVLIADEPTTALDVTIQAQIMALLKDIQEQTHMGLILITHDLALVADHADDLAVMYAGRIMEHGPSKRLLGRPAHPYTEALRASIPSSAGRAGLLRAIPGAPPPLTALPDGCSFHPRCDYRQEQCTKRSPPLAGVASDRASACFVWEEVIADAG